MRRSAPHINRAAARLVSLVLIAAGGSVHASEPFPNRDSLSSEPREELSGGDTTVFDATRNAFSLPARNLGEEHRASFFVGNSFFNQNWVAAPASTAGRDGLGPLFNARSCSACHFKDGRGRPPAHGEVMDTMLLRISVPGTNRHGGSKSDPTYGDQIQGAAIPGVPREADVLVEYETIDGAFADGERFTLRKPLIRLLNPGYGAFATNLLISARVAPVVFGLGLLEAIPETTLRALADPDDLNGDGISGRPNVVWNFETPGPGIGRFGWKAEQPTVLQHTAAAFRGDLGITSSLLPDENHSAAQTACAEQPSGGAPEITDHTLRDVALYGRTLAVPAQRHTSNAQVRRGGELFRELGCAACHTAKLQTGDWPEFPELSRQIIRPDTDLLLHDMGEGLADHRPAFAASGREWRTSPLWGLGLLKKVNGHTFLLHDGRARDATEAILWHDGEGRAARERFRELPKPGRAALVAFLESL